MAKNIDFGIMHVSDVRIDRGYPSLSAEAAEKCRKNFIEDFVKTVEAEAENGMRLFLSAGNFFDSDVPDMDTVNTMTELFTSHPDVNFVFSSGDADGNNPFYRYDILPANVTVFSRFAIRRTGFKELKTTVYGWGFSEKSRSSDPLAGRQSEPSGTLKIAVGECDLGQIMSNCYPTSKEAMENFGADYYAFGHVGSFVPGEIGKSKYVYSGMFCGRDFSEHGYGGYVLTDVRYDGSSFSLDVKYRQYEGHRYETLTLDIENMTDAETEAAALEKINANGFDNKTTLRLILTGKVSSERKVPSDFSALHDVLFSVETVDRTLLLKENEPLASDITARGEVYGILRPEIESDKERRRCIANRAVGIAIRAMGKENI